jgi:hypothetical protein
MNLINDDIRRMALLPQHCPMNPKGYASFFNDNNKLEGVSPYTLKVEKHKRDGKPVTRLEYNNFYTNWKQDSLRWYPKEITEYDTTTPVPLNNPLVYDQNLKIYEETKKNLQFAMPLPETGTNQVRVLFNDKCHVPTFSYKRYASEPVSSNTRYYNPLFIEDISKETQDLKGDWMDSAVDNAMGLYSSVFEDMYLLEGKTNNEINSNNNDNDLEYIRRTY